MCAKSTFLWLILSNLILCVSSDDDFCGFGPRAGAIKQRDLDPDCLTLEVFLKEFFRKNYS